MKQLATALAFLAAAAMAMVLCFFFALRLIPLLAPLLVSHRMFPVWGLGFVFSMVAAALAIRRSKMRGSAGEDRSLTPLMRMPLDRTQLK